MSITKGIVAFLMLAGFALAQDDDIPPPFKNLITEDSYFQLRDAHINLLRGLPADPTLRATAIQQLQQQKQRVIGTANAFGLTLPSWTPVGPNPIPNGQVTGSLSVSGRTTAFQIDPTNSNKIYLGTAQGGVYRSLDAGATWTQIFDGAQTSAIGALALAPSSPTTLYVGTGESNLSADSYAGVGLYRIDNADTTATLVGPINPVRSYIDTSSNPQSWPIFNGRSITSIAVHPSDPSIVFVGTVSGVMGIGGDSPFGGSTPPRGLQGLYRLTNATGPAAGVAQQKLVVTTNSSADNPGTGNRGIFSVILEPGNPNNMLVWVYGLAAAGDGGIYRSTNVQAATPTFTQTFTTTLSGTRGQIAMYSQASAPNVVAYVATGENNTGALRVSTDGGVTWSAFLAGGKGFCGGQCFYNFGLDVLPGPTAATSDDIIVLGGNVAGSGPTPTTLFAKSTNGGATFTESSAGLHADTHFIRIDPNNSSVIYHGDDGGIFKSINGGTTWASLNSSGINSIQFSGLAVHPTDAKWSIGGTQDNGTNMRKSDGSWTRVDYGDGGYALVDRNATDTTNMTMYHTYYNATNSLIGFGRVLSTTCASDGNWTFLAANAATAAACDGTSGANGLVISDPVLFYAPMELGPGNPNTLYFGAGAVYRSSNKGVTMTAVSQTSASVPVSSISVSPQDDNYRIFGRSDGTVFYTTTGANPMTALAGLPSGKFVGRVKFDPLNKNTAYVALGGYFGGTLSTQSHVWKVTNLNTTPVVTGINNGLPDVPVNAFAVDPTNSNNLFAGTDIGVYNSTDGGSTWAPFGTGLPTVAVFGLEVQPTSLTLRAATHGRGLYEISIAPTLNSPTISKAFSPTSIPSGGTSTVTLTLANSNGSNLTGGSLTDTLTNMSAVPGSLGGTCAASSTLTGSPISFTGITIIANSTCNITFNVTSTNVGVNPNTTSGVTTTQTPTAGPVSNTANLTVVAAIAPTISKSFSPASIPSGGTSTVTIGITNTNAFNLTGASFTDALTNMIPVPGSLGGTCVGTTSTLTGSPLSFTGMTLIANSSCNVTFSVISANVGVNPNTTSGVTTTQTPTAGAVSNTANLTVIATPTIAKAFNPASIVSGGTSTVTLTISNPNATTTLTGGSFNDALINMTAVAGTLGGSCGASSTLTGSPISFTGISIAPNASCTVTFNVTSTNVAVNPNTTSGVTTAQTTVGAASNTANLTVTASAVPATVTNVTSSNANGTYGVGGVISIQVSFSKAVNVTGTPLLALNSGGTAAYSSGSGTSTLTFTYTVAGGQNSAHLDYTSTGALALNGGTINDATPLAATLTLPAPGSAGSLGANKNIVIDTVAPTVVSYNVLFGSASYNVIGSPRNRLPWTITGIQVVFSKPITAGNINSLSGVTATGLSGLGTNTLTWTLNPITNLPLTATLLAGSGGNALTDSGGNGLAGGPGFSQNLKVLYGDFNDDGVVNAQDLAQVNVARTQAYNVFADLNGDLVVNTADVLVVRSQLGNTNP